MLKLFFNYLVNCYTNYLNHFLQTIYFNSPYIYVGLILFLHFLNKSFLLSIFMLLWISFFNSFLFINWIIVISIVLVLLL